MNITGTVTERHAILSKCTAFRGIRCLHRRAGRMYLHFISSTTVFVWSWFYSVVVEGILKRLRHSCFERRYVIVGVRRFTLTSLQNTEKKLIVLR